MSAQPVKPCAKCGSVDRRNDGRCRPCHGASNKAWNASPEGKAAKRAWGASPEGKATKKAWSASPAGKAWNASPERKAYMEAWNASPERKAAKKAWDAAFKAAVLAILNDPAEMALLRTVQ